MSQILLVKFQGTMSMGCWRNVLFLIFAMLARVAGAQTLSFTFDDGLDPRVQPNAHTWTQQILSALKTNGVEAMFFPAGKIVDSPEGLTTVEAWSSAGHHIGNHTYSHRNYGSQRMTLDVFAEDVVRAEKLLSGMPGWERRLRFPYLKEGESAAKRDAMRAWMAQHGYASAPVSIDTSDWYYDERFAAATDRTSRSFERFRQLYLHHLLQRATYYDDLARRVLGRSPSHVMLLHTNRINATFLNDAILMFKSRGWKVVAPMQAFRDPLYSMQPRVLPAGESIVWALAKEAKLPALRYPAEDGQYEKPLLDAAIDE